MRTRSTHTGLGHSEVLTLGTLSTHTGYSEYSHQGTPEYAQAMQSHSADAIGHSLRRAPQQCPQTLRVVHSGVL
jgi:hypothetical protein